MQIDHHRALHVPDAPDDLKLPLRITAYATNQTGATAPLRHLTLVGSVPVEAGLRLQWEPTAVLAPAETEELFKTLRTLVKEGRAVVLISHKLNEVMDISDRILAINFGSMITEGTAAEVQTHPEVLKAYLGED